MRITNLTDDQLNNTFHIVYRKYATDVVFCPYRIAPLGAHIDHQLGKINGFAIDVGTKIAYCVTEDTTCEFMSIYYSSQFCTDVEVNEFVCKFPWSEYCQAGIFALKQKHVLEYGIQALIDGPLPSIGLSSSASLLLSVITAMARANHIRLSSHELIELAHDAEVRFLGVMCGKLDHSCEVLAEADKMLYLDCLDNSYALAKNHCDPSSYRWMVCYSGVSANLASVDYNQRRNQCKQAAQLLLECAGIHANIDSVTFRAVPDYIYKAYRTQLPTDLRKRADHFYTEMRRVECGLNAWESGDMIRYGKLMTESGSSSIVNYECGCTELTELYNILANVDGVYGTRFSGAGFRGCCIALIDPSKEDNIAATVTQKYVDKFPRFNGTFFARCFDSCHGIHEVL